MNGFVAFVPSVVDSSLTCQVPVKAELSPAGRKKQGAQSFTSAPNWRMCTSSFVAPEIGPRHSSAVWLPKVKAVFAEAP